MNKFIINLKENWLNYTILILLVVMIFSSSVGSMSSSLSSKSLSINQDSYYGNELTYNSGFASEVENRKITKNGNLNLETSNYILSKQNILSVSENYNVIFLRNNENTGNNNYKSLTLSGKINSNNLEVYLNELKSFGEVDYFEIYSNDVTENYVNYDERINRYSNQLSKYEYMLSEEITIDEEIKIQERIDNLEDNLFYLKKNFQNLDDKVIYSQIDIRLSEKKSLLDEVEFINLENGFKGFIESLGAALWFLIYIFGFLLPFGFIYGFYKIIRKLFSI
jgi:hypothetical protein